MSRAGALSSLRVGCVVYPGVTALDLVGPHEVLMRTDAQCVVVARRLEPVVCNGGLRLIPDHTFSACPPLDVLLVPGGPGQTPAMDDAELIGFLTERAAQARWTAAVCTGSLLLGRAGVLRGRAATTHWLAMAELEQWGARATRRRVVRDGPVVPGAGFSAGLDLALWLVSALAGREEAQRVQLAIEYDPHPPFDSGAPEKAPSHIVQLLRAGSRFPQQRS
jgi:transcriptional regulator GlxA family with amidase domain